MKIYLATDHAGFELKEKLKTYLQELGHEIQDFGAFQYNKEDDYPDFIRKAAEALSLDGERRVLHNRAIIFGGSGQGEAMVANRFKGVRAVVCDDASDLETKVLVWREHNNSNILSIGARFIDETSAKKAVKLWLEVPFTAELRHVRRIQKIDE